MLYMLLHGRYVLSPRGLDTMRRIIAASLSSSTIRQGGKTTTSSIHIFGKCTRVGCHGMPLLPYGLYEETNYKCHFEKEEEEEENQKRKAMRYCCSCGEVFYYWKSTVNGCVWGPTFCHLLLMTHGDELFPQIHQDLDLRRRRKDFQKDNEVVIAPRIFGFGLHPAAKIRYPLDTCSKNE